MKKNIDEYVELNSSVIRTRDEVNILKVLVSLKEDSFDEEYREELIKKYGVSANLNYYKAIFGEGFYKNGEIDISSLKKMIKSKEGIITINDGLADIKKNTILYHLINNDSDIDKVIGYLSSLVINFEEKISELKEDDLNYMVLFSNLDSQLKSCNDLLNKIKNLYAATVECDTVKEK